MWPKRITPLCVVLAGVFATQVFAQGKVDLSAEAKAAADRVAQATLVPHEINAIAWRRDLMGKPGLQFYVVFFNAVGQPVDYFMTAGKCSSSTKRLTKPWQFQRGQIGVDKDGYAVHGDFVMSAPDLDGTHGSSDSYVFCQTVDGKYKQWNGRYYASNAPIELTIKPLVVRAGGGIQKQQ